MPTLHRLVPNPKYPGLVIEVRVTDDGQVVVDGGHQQLDPHQALELAGMLTDAAEKAPAIAEAIADAKRMEQMAKRAKEDRLTAIMRGE